MIKYMLKFLASLDDKMPAAFKDPAFVVLHLSHQMLPLWMPLLLEAKLIPMPPVVLVGSHPNFTRPHATNPTHHHETYYPFKYEGSNGTLKHPDMKLILDEFGGRTWQELFKSAHKAALSVSKEERKVVNDAAAEAGFWLSSDDHTSQGKKKNFR